MSDEAVTRSYFRKGRVTQCEPLISRRALRSDKIILVTVLDAGGNRSAHRKSWESKFGLNNQMHISVRTRNWTWDSLVQSEGRYTLCQPCFPSQYFKFEIHKPWKTVFCKTPSSAKIHHIVTKIKILAHKNRLGK